MTCCIGIEDGPNVWLGADSAATDDYGTQSIVTQPKAWAVGSWGFAYAGSIRSGELIKHEFTPPKKINGDIEKYLQTKFISKLKHILRNEDEESKNDLSLLVAIKGKVYEVSGGSWELTNSNCGYAAIGTQDALIGLAVTSDITSPKKRIQKVLKAVTQHISSVKPPFTIIKIS